MTKEHPEMMITFGESGPLDETLRKYGIPEHMHFGITAYIVHGIPPGHFLEAVLSNNLREAAARADSENQAALFQWVNWLYNEAPSQCWGSPEKVTKWIESKRAERQGAEAGKGETG